MDVSDRKTTYCDKEGDDKSACLVRKDRSKELDSNTCRQVDDIFGASSLMGGGDGITEMIYGIANSIKFDDVLEELRELFPKTVENNEASHTVSDILPDYGSSTARTKEVAEPNCATEGNTKKITYMLQGLSAVPDKQRCVTEGNKDSLQIARQFRDVPAEMINRGRIHKTT